LVKMGGRSLEKNSLALSDDRTDPVDLLSRILLGFQNMEIVMKPQQGSQNFSSMQIVTGNKELKMFRANVTHSVDCGKGVIHIIDNVPAFPLPCLTTMKLSELNAYLYALNQTNLIDSLSASSGVTVFAFTDDAWMDFVRSSGAKYNLNISEARILLNNFVEEADWEKALGKLTEMIKGNTNESNVNATESEKQNHIVQLQHNIKFKEMKPLMRYHIVAGKVLYSNELLRLSESTKEPVKLSSHPSQSYMIERSKEDGSIRINGAKIITSDILMMNGVMHVLDRVITLPTH